MKMKIVLAVLLLSLMVGTAVYAAIKEGAKAPDFKLESISGKTLSLEEIRKDPKVKGANRVVLLDFWATWCPPCKRELPHLQKLHEKYGKKGLVVVGVAMDRGGMGDVKPFVKEQKLTYTILVDPKGTTKSDYGIQYFPTTVIVDKKGIVRKVHIGYSDGMEKDLEKEILALLK